MIYKEKKENFIPDVEVTGCFILVGAKFLLLNRVAHKWEGGKWGPPGGKVDKRSGTKRNKRRNRYNNCKRGFNFS